MELRDGRTCLLSDAFYERYPPERFPELERKKNRPYVLYLIELDEGVWFGLPLRSHIRHPYLFRTSADGGLDYTKAIPILDPSFVNMSRRAWVRPEELPVIRRNRHAIKEGFLAYIELYREARRHPERTRNTRILSYSTLQYFEEELGLAAPKYQSHDRRVNRLEPSE